MDTNELEKLKLYHRYLGANIAMRGLHDALSEIQVFTLSKLWPEGSKELDAVADAIEGVKAMIVMRNNKIMAAAKEIVDGDSGTGSS